LQKPYNSGIQLAKVYGFSEEIAMLKRKMAKTVEELAKGFPVISITGPRQSGKTTLAQMVFPDKQYVSLELPHELDWATRDPVSFLDRFPDGGIIDEIQLCPDLFSHLQVRVDKAKIMGQFVITGSQQFSLNAKISQSLAGRVGNVSLLPLSLDELKRSSNKFGSLDDFLYSGFYPAIYDRKIKPLTWHANYLKTYLERDVRQLTMVTDILAFQNFVRLCASRTGQLLNINNLASDCGINSKTVKKWLSILEASYVIKLLQPYHNNFRKRLVKSPKLFFVDVGLAAYLLGIEDSKQIATHPLRGALFETFVFGELLKARLNSGLESNLFFWRNNHGIEVDFIFNKGETIHLVEAKSGATISEDSFRGLRKLKSISGSESIESYLVHGGSENGSRSGDSIVSWDKLSIV
jgi:hypothetical protein